MNMNQIAYLLTQKFNLNQNQQSNLSQSIEKARTLLNSVNNPTEALSKANIDPGFLEKIKGYLNNPMYSFLLPMIGIDKKVALQKIDSLEQMLNNQSTNPTTYSNESQTSSFPTSQNDDLERFRKGLNSFK